MSISVKLDSLHDNMRAICGQTSTDKVARAYGFIPNRAGMISCPFHGQDLHPSMKVYPDAFHCFTCGWHGDVICFVSDLTGSKSLEAAKELNDRFSLGLKFERRNGQTREERAQLRHRAEERERQEKLQQAFEQWETRAWQILSTRLRQLRQWKREYMPKEIDEELDSRYVEACQQLEYIEYLCDTLQYSTPEDKIIFYIERQKEVSKIEQQTDRGAAGSSSVSGTAGRTA